MTPEISVVLGGILQARNALAVSLSKEALDGLAGSQASIVECGPVFACLSNDKMLYGCEVCAITDASLPNLLIANSTTFERILDHIYVPMPRDAATTIAVLNLCAPVYESLINRERNIANYIRLLDCALATVRMRAEPLHILDFGCGSGLIMEAVARRPVLSPVLLEGIDAAPSMRELAQQHGLPTIDKIEDRTIDIILASYVLQGGILKQDIELLLAALTDGGVLVANWLHTDDATLNEFVQTCQLVRPGTGAFFREESRWKGDPMVVYQVNG
jgi:hypothetical protein